LILIAILTAPTIVNNAAASTINIIDYDLEGIDADTSQYYVLWVRGEATVPLEVNASVLEFVGSTGITFGLTLVFGNRISTSCLTHLEMKN
jgi:hypothetical protein